MAPDYGFTLEGLWHGPLCLSGVLSVFFRGELRVGGVGWCRVVSGCRVGVGLVSDDSVGLSNHPSVLEQQDQRAPVLSVARFARRWTELPLATASE